jgi:hypothetical protein
MVNTSITGPFTSTDGVGVGEGSGGIYSLEKDGVTDIVGVTDTVGVADAGGGI